MRPPRVIRYGLNRVAADNGRALPPQNHRPALPSKFEWIVAVLAVIIQMGAFLSLPAVINGSSLMPDVRDPLNLVAIALSMISIGIVCAPRIRQLGVLASRNVPSVLFILLVLASALWSIHPDVTIRRGLGYVLTIVIAGYLAVRFHVHDRMRVLSWGFAIAAIGSLLFVAALPQYGIMGGGGLAGEWRGVFPHKNVLGPVMAVAVFTELYLLVVGNGRPRWRWGLLGGYLALIVLSHSATGLLLAVFYVTGTCIFLAWKRQRLAGVLASMVSLLFLSIVLFLLRDDPERVLGIIGKDATLSGRTAIWNVVLPFIRERPVLGWGYRAMWQSADANTALADQLARDWGVQWSHNTFLEITLQLGLVGMGVMMIIIGVALWRGLRCCKAGILPLGWFSLMFFLGALLAGQVELTLGQNQIIEWVMFNVLAFSCGLALPSPRENSLPSVRQSVTSRVRQQAFG
jgi:exopolysaccharide production protein ExoQ